MKNFFVISSIFLFFSFVVLNRGFSNIGIAGIPIFQLISLLLVFSITILYPRTFYNFPKQLIKAAIPYIIFSILIFISSIFSGNSFIRIVQDYELIYNLGYALIGYFVASNLKYSQIISILNSVFITCFISSIIILLFLDQLQSISPIVGIFQERYLLGNNVGYFINLMIGGFFYLYVNNYNFYSYFLFPLLVASSLLEQRRFSIILFVLFFTNYIFGSKILSKRFSRIFYFLIPLIFLFFLLNILNFEGERGDFSIDFFSQLYLSILGSSDNALSGAIFWRLNVINDVLSLNNTMFNTLFGVGFGIPLSSHIDPATSLATRQSHIFLFDIYVRLGIVGFLLGLNFYFKLFLYLFKNRSFGNFNNWIYIVGAGVFLAAQTNPILQIIEIAYPMYFLLGIGIYVIENKSYSLK